MEPTRKVPIRRLCDGKRESADDIVPYEMGLTFVVEGHPPESMIVSPGYLRDFAAGYLRSRGLIRAWEDVRAIEVDEEEKEIRVSLHPGSGEDEACPVLEEDDIRFDYGRIRELVGHLLTSSKTFRETGGTHSALLASPDDVLFQCDDIGRHNAVDKVLGAALVNGITVRDQALVFTGRISTEIVHKAVRHGVPIIATKAAVTSAGISLADKMGITLVGFVRNESMNVYTHPERILDRGRARTDSQETR